MNFGQTFFTKKNFENLFFGLTRSSSFSLQLNAKTDLKLEPSIIRYMFSKFSVWFIWK